MKTKSEMQEPIPGELRNIPLLEMQEPIPGELRNIPLLDAEISILKCFRAYRYTSSYYLRKSLR